MILFVVGFMYFSIFVCRSRVLFTSSPHSTAETIHELFWVENKGCFSINSADVSYFGRHAFIKSICPESGTSSNQANQIATALSMLRSLPGVSALSALLLIRHFGSLRNLLTASVNQLQTRVPSLSIYSANLLHRQLHKTLRALKKS